MQMSPVGQVDRRDEEGVWRWVTERMEKLHRMNNYLMGHSR
jgi:hypothetical protein